MDKVNIPRYIEDPHYRYKMSIPDVSFQKGYTIITNLDIISKQLYRDSSTLLSHFAKDLSCSKDLKRKGIRGKKTKEDILTSIDKFIEKEVLCKECQNPETVLSENHKKCKACGKAEKISTNVKPKKQKIKKEVEVEEMDEDDWSLPTDTESVKKRLQDLIDK